MDTGPHGGSQFVKLRAVGGGEISRFEGINFEVKKFPGLHGGVFDEFPRAAAHGPAGLAHITEVSFAADPKEVTCESGLASGFEQWEDGAAINPGGRLSTGSIDRGSEEVHREGLKIGGAGFDDTGPNCSGRHLDAAFIHVLLFSAEVSTTGPDVDLSAVVGDEEDEGVVPLAVFLEGGNDFADAIVHVFDEGDEFGTFFGDAFFAGFDFGEPVGGRLDGCVGCVVGEIEEEGLGFILLRVVGEIGGGPIGEEVGSVPLGLYRFPVQAHVVLAVPAVLIVIIHHVAQEPVKMVEATGVRVFGVIQSEVPFADGSGGIALLFEGLREHCGGAGEKAPIVFRFGADDSGNTDEIRVASGEEGGAGGGADGTVGIEFGKADAIGEEGVNVGAFKVGGAVAGEISVAEIIDDDQEDVWFPGGEGEGR